MAAGYDDIGGEESKRLSWEIYWYQSIYYDIWHFVIIVTIEVIYTSKFLFENIKFSFSKINVNKYIWGAIIDLKRVCILIQF